MGQGGTRQGCRALRGSLQMQDKRSQGSGGRRGPEGRYPLEGSGQGVPQEVLLSLGQGLSVLVCVRLMTKLERVPGVT